MPENILAIQDLKIRLPAQSGYFLAVDGIDLALNQGETLCLVGESGSGKTVTAQSIMRLLDRAEYGQNSKIIHQDQDLLLLPEIELHHVRGKKIAMIFQEPMTSLNPVLTIGFQITEVIKLHLHYTKQQAKDRALSLLTEVGMTDSAHVFDQYPHQLSGGMRQRVMIAMALATEPDILIADEPTTALDVTIQAQILALIKKLIDERNMGLLFITHDLAVVYHMADTVAVMYQGKIVETAPCDVFFKGPKHEYSRELLACARELTGEGVSLALGEKVLKSPILAVNNLTVHYPIKKGLFKRTVGHTKAVDGISFTLNKGETLAIVGESGSGKSSAAFALLRLLDCAKGEVMFHDTNLLTLSERKLRQLRRYIQMIFQDPFGSLNPRMNVREILSEGWDAQGLFQNESKRELELKALLDSVGLTADSLDRYPHEFSGGQHQRIAIARAIAMQPEIIVCDEPTSALDVSVQSQIIHLLKKLQQEKNLSYIFISHNIPVVSYLAHYVAVMHLGEIVEYGSVYDIMNNPQHPYTKSLLAAVPTLYTEDTHD